MNEKIKGGFYIKPRCIQQSEIQHAPPQVREIWDLLIMRAVYDGYKIQGRILRRGQCFVSLNDLQEGLKWYAGARKMVYSKDKCEYAMNWLRKRDMITTVKTTRGLVVTICKYDYYQDSNNYESNGEAGVKATRSQRTPETINKERNKKKTIPLDMNDSGFKPGNEKDRDFLHEKINDVNQKYPTLLQFEKPLTVEELANLIKKYTWPAVEDIFIAIENVAGVTKKNRSAYLTARNWLNRNRKER